MELDNVLTVDPGLSTAYTLWKDNWPAETWLLHWDKKGKYVENRLGPAGAAFHDILCKLKPDWVFIEDVEVWASSAKSITSATRGDLIWLSKLIGVYGFCCVVEQIPFRYVKPREWKGQLSKIQVARVVYQVYGLRFRTPRGKLEDHKTDSVGIGLGLMGGFVHKNNAPDKDAYLEQDVTTKIRRKPRRKN